MHGSGRATPPPKDVGPPPGPDPFASGAEQPKLIDGATFLGLNGPDPFDSGADAAADSGPRYGPVIRAGYDGECSEPFCVEGGYIVEGDDIRADGEGGWIHSVCAEDAEECGA
jgi:hypothetical protein